jgi:hypothetical protein
VQSLVLVLIILAGASEAAGQLLPVVGRRTHASGRLVAGLLLAGTLIEATVIALWPVAAWKVALRVTDVSPETSQLSWTPALVAPMLLAAILAFPLLGPLLHLALLVGVGTGLVGPLSVASGLGWWAAAGCIGLAGVGLALSVAIVRRLVAIVIAAGVTEAVA